MLRLGVLVCDHVSPEFLHIAGDYPDMIGRLFAGYPGIEPVAFDLAAGSFPSSASECDAWITTGSRHSVYDDQEWITRLRDLVVDIAASKGRYVGICFGHQMLAHALGGRVERATAGWGVGLEEVALVDPLPWLPGSSYRILNSHADQITAVPEGGRIRGQNDHCPVSLLTVGDHMLGIQGHPEFTRDYMRALLVARRGSLIPAGTADAALGSLGDAPDTALLTDGIAAFLAGA